jgi:stress response protein YsnF
MEEVPVTEQVELLEERTSIEHRPVNRRLTEEEIAASGLLQDRVVEIAQMREEAVITKEAFVREELVVKKTIEKRVEQVHETIRRTAVEMERMEPELAGGAEDRLIRRD